MFENKKIFILGMARSGYEVSKLLSKYDNDIIVTDKKDQDIKNIRIFESKIAPSSQGEIKRIGGAKQILVPDRNIWTDAVKIEELKIE